MIVVVSDAGLHWPASIPKQHDGRAISHCSIPASFGTLQLTGGTQAMRIVKFGKGMDAGNTLAGLLGPSFDVVEFDSSMDPMEQVRDAEVLLLRDMPVPAAVIDAAPK